jgi:hypothetical protein
VCVVCVCVCVWKKERRCGGAEREYLLFLPLTGIILVVLDISNMYRAEINVRSILMQGQIFVAK